MKVILDECLPKRLIFELTAARDGHRAHGRLGWNQKR